MSSFEILGLFNLICGSIQCTRFERDTHMLWEAVSFELHISTCYKPNTFYRHYSSSFPSFSQIGFPFIGRWSLYPQKVIFQVWYLLECHAKQCIQMLRGPVTWARFLLRRPTCMISLSCLLGRYLCGCGRMAVMESTTSRYVLRLFLKTMCIGH